MKSNFEVLVQKRHDEALQIVVFELKSVDSTPLPPWSAGAHIDVQTRDDTGREVQRQYSLCGPRTSPYWTIAVQAADEGRGGARWLHRVAQTGSHLTVSTPRNHFQLHEGTAPTVLVAGGIGITPLLAMARELQARGSPFLLHYFARSRPNAAFLDTLAHSTLAGNAHLYFDDESSHSTPSIAEIFSDTDLTTRVYVCGPSRFMDKVIEQAHAHGIPSGNVHREVFSVESDAFGHAADDAFEIEIRSTGKVIQVARACSAVQALETAGIDITVSCEQGLCGSCVTGVLDGTPDHRDQFLLPEEQALNNCFTPCCSRALSKRLVLDL